MRKAGWLKLLCVSITLLAAACSEQPPPPANTGIAANRPVPPPAPATVPAQAGPDAPIDPVTDYDRVEDAQSLAGAYLKKAVSAHLLRRDVEGLRPFLADDFRARFATPEDGKQIDEARVFITDFAGATVPETDAKDFLPRLKKLVDRYSSITRSQFRCFTFLLDKGGKRALARYHWWLS